MRLLLKSKPYHRVHARSTGVNQCLCVCVYVSVCQQKQQVAKVFTDFILNPNKQYLITQVKVVLILYMYIFFNYFILFICFWLHPFQIACDQSDIDTSVGLCVYVPCVKRRSPTNASWGKYCMNALWHPVYQSWSIWLKYQACVKNIIPLTPRHPHADYNHLSTYMETDL